MHIHIIAIGALKRGPERELVDDYMDRFQKTGRQIGLRSLTEHELPSANSRDDEALRILARVPHGAVIAALDERGKAQSSQDWGDWVGDLRDRGTADLAFLIGGAEGHGAAVRSAADRLIAFGPQTWPHKLVRVMLTEQIYRSATLLAGTPYHKA
ncbi:MAG: 23S rRNA (pseudouridine(1915)-N(3))-methyltransferase RlmH [Pseudomonadota bacterium]